MQTYLTLMILAGLILTMALAAGLKRVPVFSRFNLLWNSILFLSQSSLILVFAFFCFVCVRILIAIIMHNQSYHAMPFTYTTSCFLVLPLILLLVKSFYFYFTSRPPQIKSTALYIVTLLVYLVITHIGLTALTMVVEPTTQTQSIMGFLSVLTIGFYLYTYRQFRRLFG